MRTPFRFPRATVILLIANFVGAMFIIAKGKAMSRLIGVWPVFGSVVLHLAVFALLTMCAAAVFWGILHNLRRSGVHRLESVQINARSSSSSGRR